MRGGATISLPTYIGFLLTVVFEPLADVSRFLEHPSFLRQRLKSGEMAGINRGNFLISLQFLFEEFGKLLPQGQLP